MKHNHDATAPTSLPGRIFGSLMRIDRSIHRLFRDFSRERNMSIHQSLIIHALACSTRPLTLRELAEKLAIAKSTASTEVDKLVKAGAVIREPDPDCRRKIKIQLSGAGIELARQNLAFITDIITAKLQDLPESDLASIEVSLSKLETVLANPDK